MAHNRSGSSMEPAPFLWAGTSICRARKQGMRKAQSLSLTRKNLRSNRVLNCVLSSF